MATTVRLGDVDEALGRCQLILEKYCRNNENGSGWYHRLASDKPGPTATALGLHFFHMHGVTFDHQYDGISRKLAGHWRHPVLFEHGSCAGPDVATGACISHAHWHLVPGDYDLGARSLVFTPAMSFDALGVADRSNGYLMYRRRPSWFYNLDTNHRASTSEELSPPGAAARMNGTIWRFHTWTT